MPQEYFWFIGLQLAMAATGLVTRKHIVHLMLPMLWFSLTVFYVLMSTLGQIASSG